MVTENTTQEHIEEVVLNPDPDQIGMSSEETETKDVQGATTEDTAVGDTADVTTEDGVNENTDPTWDKFTYKVRDEEKSFDDWVKPYIKDEESYKNFQDLFTARDGIALAKQERDSIQQEYEQVKQSLQTVNHYVNKGDAESFIKALGLPEKMFIDYAINKIQYQEMTPEQRQVVDAQNRERSRLHQLELQNQSLQQQFETQQRNQRSAELDAGLNDPDILPLVQEFDARAGRPGAFRQAAIERGIFQYQVNGVDMSAKDVINDAISYLGLTRSAGAPNQHNVQAGTRGQHPATKPVIPNIQGRGTSPVTSRQVRSIEDIKRIRAEKLAAQGI